MCIVVRTSLNKILHAWAIYLNSQSSYNSLTMKILTKYLLFVTLIFLFSCRGNNTQAVKVTESNYTVIKEDVLYIPDKSQITTYVLYKDSVYAEPVLRRIALEIYDKSSKIRLQNNEQAKIIMVYIYATQEDYANDKRNCITTLYKGISDTQPEIAYTMPKKVLPEQPEEPEPPEEATSENTSHEVIQKANERYFSVWDGSNTEFVEAVKNKMNDPNSFKHVETRYDDRGSYLRIQMTYRGKNAFNATITATSTCKFNKSTRTITEIN